MFTGIIEEVATVRAVKPGWLVIEASKVMDDIKLGASIGVNGTCLTVTSHEASSFSVDVVPETLRRTNLGSLKVGDPVNLERPVAVGGRLDGHIVQGHVDGTGTICSIAMESDALLVRIQASPSIMRYVVEKGFIAIDGTSMTVVNCVGDSFLVTVIPYTRENTVFGSNGVGDLVNLEVDILAKYVERLSVGATITTDVGGATESG